MQNKHVTVNKYN